MVARARARGEPAKGMVGGDAERETDKGRAAEAHEGFAGHRRHGRARQ